MTGALWHDHRFALRGLRRRPGFAAVAVLTLALGIGANSAIFSVDNGVLRRPWPCQRPNELASVWVRWPVATLASLLPAVRATHTDPVEALRSE
jgi:hypothetical protein